MRFPNSRYGNPQEMQYYTQGMPISAICKRLRRSEKSVRAWLNGDRKIPFWVPELLRLQHIEHMQIMKQMGIADQRKAFGIVKSQVIEFAPRKTVLHGARMSGAIPGDVRAPRIKRVA